MTEQNGTNAANDALTRPPADDFNTEALQGSMQQVLSENIGRYASIDFLIGTQFLETRAGYIYDVGIGYVALTEDISQSVIVCDVFSIKFVTFYAARPNTLPTAMNTTSQQRSGIPASSTATALSSPNAQQQAALLYARRKARN